jgi:hypothetical protein
MQFGDSYYSFLCCPASHHRDHPFKNGIAEHKTAITDSVTQK